MQVNSKEVNVINLEAVFKSKQTLREISRFNVLMSQYIKTKCSYITPINFIIT